MLSFLKKFQPQYAYSRYAYTKKVYCELSLSFDSVKLYGRVEVFRKEFKIIVN